MSETTSTRDQALAALQQASQGLAYMSESDFPMEPFYWTQQEVGAEKITPEAVAALAKQAGAPVKTQDMAKFFAPATEDQGWYGDEEKRMAQGFRDLVQVLKTSLTDLKAYKIGKQAERAVYVVGKTPEGDFAGVSTRVVET